MPEPKKGELSRDFLNRCIPQVIKDGITLRSGEKVTPHQKQAVAVCFSMFRGAKKKKKKVKTEKKNLNQ